MGQAWVVEVRVPQLIDFAVRVATGRDGKRDKKDERSRSNRRSAEPMGQTVFTSFGRSLIIRMAAAGLRTLYGKFTSPRL